MAKNSGACKALLHRWLKEWLPGLSPRAKWFNPERNFVKDDIVLVISPDASRGHWPLAKVINTYLGTNGHVRVAKVQVGSKVLVRPVTRLCPLEHASEEKRNIEDSRIVINVLCPSRRGEWCEVKFIPVDPFLVIL